MKLSEQTIERIVSEADLQNALDLFSTFCDNDDFVNSMVNYLAGQISGDDLLDEIDAQADYHKTILKS